jgi:hypothetical protein
VSFFAEACNAKMKKEKDIKKKSALEVEGRGNEKKNRHRDR